MEPEANAPRTVSGSVDNRELDVPHSKVLAVVEIFIHRKRLIIPDPKELTLLDEILVQRLICTMEQDSRRLGLDRRPPLLHPARGTHMIQVSMRMKKVFDLHRGAARSLHTFEVFEDLGSLVTRIH